MTDKDIEKDVEARLFDVFNGRRGKSSAHFHEPNLLAYIALMAMKRGLSAEAVTQDEITESIASCPVSDDSRVALRELVSGDSVDAIRSLMSGFAENELEHIVLHCGGSVLDHFDNYDLPNSLQRLAAELLCIENADYVADFNCEGGDFLVNTLEAKSPAKVYGNASHSMDACLAEARLSLFDAEYVVERQSIYQGNHLRAFDKIYYAPSFARVADLAAHPTPYLKPFIDGTDPMGRPASSGWINCRIAFDSLLEGGTAIVVVGNGAVFAGSDARARRYFIENGMIRAAIALPEKLLRETCISLTLLVLGKNDGPIRIVDATDLGTPGRRTNSLSDDDISEIEVRLSNDGDMSRLVDRDEFASCDYSLFAPRYFGGLPNLVNPDNLGDIALSIERGASIRAADLDGLTTFEDTGFYFLRISDIVDGSISDELPHLKNVGSFAEKQCLRSGDLVLSKNGAPFKVAVADVPEGRTVLANGNLYIIRLDTKRVDPYFVAAYLASEDGKRCLKSMVVGTVIPNLPLRNLRSVQVPVPDMETQRRVAAKYRADLDQIAVLKIRLDSARAALSASYDEEMGR